MTITTTTSENKVTDEMAITSTANVDEDETTTAITMQDCESDHEPAGAGAAVDTPGGRNVDTDVMAVSTVAPAEGGFSAADENSDNDRDNAHEDHANKDNDDDEQENEQSNKKNNVDDKDHRNDELVDEDKKKCNSSNDVRDVHDTNANNNENSTSNNENTNPNAGVAAVADTTEDDSDDDDDDDGDLTVIALDSNLDDHGQTPTIDWIEQTGPEMEQRRRNVLLRELRRVQRASFIHFVLLCLIPTALLLIVVATVVGEEEECDSEATYCFLEERTFINAFTTRCVCEAIKVPRTEP